MLAYYVRGHELVRKESHTIRKEGIGYCICVSKKKRQRKIKYVGEIHTL